MQNTKDIILKLKKVRDEKELSLNDIVSLVEKNGDYISRSSIQRVFADGSEDVSFRYEETIRPIAKAILDMENIEDDDDIDTQALKALLKYKIQRIEDLEQQNKYLQTTLDKEKIKYHEKMDAERERYNKSIEFLKEQVALKDKRMDILLESVQKKDSRYEELITRVMACQRCMDNRKGGSYESV